MSPSRQTPRHPQTEGGQATRSGRVSRHNRSRTLLCLLVMVGMTLSGCAGAPSVSPALQPHEGTQDAPEMLPEVALQATTDGTGVVLTWQTKLVNSTPLQRLQVQIAPLPSLPDGSSLLQVSDIPDASASGSQVLPLPPGTWYVRLRAEDTEGRVGWSGERSVEVVALAAAAIQSVDAGQDILVRDVDGNGEQPFPLSGTALAGPGSTITAYAWYEGTSKVSDSAHTTLTRPVGTHHFTFRVHYEDSNGVASSATDRVQVDIIANQAPTAKTGEDVTRWDGDGDGEEPVFLDGSNSSDEDGDLAAHSWTLADGAEILDAISGLVALPVAEAPHVITYTVTDDGGASHQDTTQVTVHPNRVPTAHAGADQTVTDNDRDAAAAVTLSGGQSVDPDGYPLAYQWTWKSNGTKISQQTTVTRQLPVGTHTFVLAVTDAAGAKDVDEVQVVVHPTPPVVADLQRGSCDVLTCTFDASGSSGVGSLSYEWDLGDGNHTTTAIGSLVHTYAEKGTYDVTLTVTDSTGESAEATVDATVDGIQVSTYDWVFQGLQVLPCFNCGSFLLDNALTNPDQTETRQMLIHLPAGAEGHAFTLESFHPTVNEIGLKPDIAFYTTCDGQGAKVGGDTYESSLVSAYLDTLSTTGTVPPGAGCAVISESATLGVLVTQRLTIHDMESLVSGYREVVERVLVPCQGCLLAYSLIDGVAPPLYSVSYQTQVNGIDAAWILLDENDWGKEFELTATSMSSVIGPEDPDIAFLPTCFDATNPMPDQNVNGLGLPERGIIPEGAGCAWVNGYVDDYVDFHLKIGDEL